MIWGFALLGASFGLTTRSFVETSNLKDYRKKEFEGTLNTKSRRMQPKVPTKSLDENSLLNRRFLTPAFLLLGIALSMPPTYADARIFNALRSSNLKSLSMASELTGATLHHKELLVDQFAQAGQKEEALQLARELVREEPRSWRGWVEIALSDAAKIDEKVTAFSTLIELDPRNEEIKRGLDLIQSGLGVETLQNKE